MVAVDGVDLDIEEGQLLVLLGPSGSGKSTLLQAIAGLVSVEQGSIRLRGEDTTNRAIRDRGVAMVLQNLGLYPTMTVRQNVAYPLRLRGVSSAEQKSQIDVLLQLLGLSDLSDRLPRQVSGGQRQRVAIARALARRSDILLLDEPFSDLDAQTRFSIRRDLKILHQDRGLTTVLVTHDQEDALALADEIALMSDGKIVETGTPKALYGEPKSIFAARFLGRPPMNLFHIFSNPDGQLIAKDGTVFPVELGVRLGSDSEWLIGVRPEHLRATAGSGWRVQTKEAAGVCDFLYVETGQWRACSQTDSGSNHAPGDVVQLAIKGPVHVFDPSTGRRVT